MHTFFKRKLFIIALTFLCIIASEMCVFLIIYKRAYADAFLMEIGIYILLLCPAFLFFKNRHTIIYTSTLLTSILFLFALNITLNYNSRDIFTFNYISQVGEAASIFNPSYLYWGALLLFFGFEVIYIIGLILIYKVFIKGKDEVGKHHPAKSALICLSLMIISLATMTINVESFTKMYPNASIFENMDGYEIISYLSKYLKKTSMKKIGVINYSLATVEDVLNKKVNTTEIKETKEEPNNLDTTYGIEDITEVTDEYFGLLKDYNVIEIMIESGSMYLLNETLTPNLYKLASEGIYFTNNYSKNKTNVSEFIGIAGAATSNVESITIDIPYALPNMLKNEGYNSSYFHNNYGNFYSRDKLMGQLGFDNSYFSLDINPNRQWNNNYDGNYPLDSETLEDIIDNLAPACDTPYYSYWTTLSMHGPYDGALNWEKFQNMGYVEKLKKAEDEGLWENICKDDSEAVQAQIEMIMCETMDLDYAIGNLMKHLEKNNQLDKTLLVLYGDHETYYNVGIDRPLKEYVFNCEDETYPNQYQTMLYMYNETLTKKYKEVNQIEDTNIAYYNDFTSPYIIVPTILELLGINYNKEGYIGTSIFQTKSSLENVFYSHEFCSFISDKIYTNDILDDITYMAEDIDMDYIEEFRRCSFQLLERIANIETMYFSNTFS